MARFLWTQKQDIGPKPRLGHAMAYDAARGHVVLFGGNSLASGLFNDTWEWDGENWTQMADIGPSPRQGCSLTYDSARGRVVLFGGDSQDAFLGDTWEWDGVDWTQVADTGPAPRTNQGTALESARGRVLLFGGMTSNFAIFRDTWRWDGVEWTQQEDTGPSARRSMAMSYDGVRERAVLVGGAAADGVGFGDTWEWDGSVWTQVSDFGVDPCMGAAMVFKGDKAALYGGMQTTSASPPQQVLGNTWVWDGKHWTKRQDIGPGPRWQHAMAYDSTRGRIVLFGGLRVFSAGAGDLLGDTWEHFEPPPPLALQSVVLTPPQVRFSENTPVAGIITLTAPAPAAGINVNIEAFPLPTLPIVVIPGGLTTGRFTVDTTSLPAVLSASITIVFTASIPGSTKTGILTVLAQAGG